MGPLRGSNSALCRATTCSLSGRRRTRTTPEGDEGAAPKNRPDDHMRGLRGRISRRVQPRRARHETNAVRMPPLRRGRAAPAGRARHSPQLPRPALGPARQSRRRSGAPPGARRANSRRPVAARHRTSSRRCGRCAAPGNARRCSPRSPSLGCCSPAGAPSPGSRTPPYASTTKGSTPRRTRRSSSDPWTVPARRLPKTRHVASHRRTTPHPTWATASRSASKARSIHPGSDRLRGRVRVACPAAACVGSMIRVLLADDQGLVRVGFRMILRAEPDIEVVDEAADGHEAGTRRWRSASRQRPIPRGCSCSPPSTWTNTCTRRFAPAPATSCSRTSPRIN